MSIDTTPREINTPQVRQAISAAIHNEVSVSGGAHLATAAVFVILDLASAGQLPPLCDSCGEPMEHGHEVGARAGDIAVCSACADDAEAGQ